MNKEALCPEAAHPEQDHPVSGHREPQEPQSSTENWRAIRGEILTFTDDPDSIVAAGHPVEAAYRYFADGILLAGDGLIQALGPAEEILARLPPEVEIVHYPHGLILPGFIDTHIHFPQVDVMASYGTQLLEWLNNYTFPAESRFADKAVASETAAFFLQELLRCGTTTALVFATVHPQSVDAFFEVSQSLNTRMICGKVMMDCNAPASLTDTVDSSYADSRALIEKWHGKGRQLYAVTPRFAITSSDLQLQRAGELLQEYPGTYLQTHLSENLDELAAVKQLHPAGCDYLDVYDRHGLLSARSVFAHGIHLNDRELGRLRETQSSIAFCPTSNLFLGSGLLDLKRLDAAKVSCSIATDVGGGTSFSMLQTLNEAYKVAQLEGHSLAPLKAFYMVTLGNARTLRLDHRIGTLEPGTEADFVVLDYNCTPLMARRMASCQSLQERLFALMILGDDRATSATWVAGNCVYERATGIISPPVRSA
jgi:guanine deaminase